MKRFKTLSLALLLCASSQAYAGEISSKPLYVPEDPDIAAREENRVELLEKEIRGLLGRVELLEHTVSQLRSSQGVLPQSAQNASPYESEDMIKPAPNPVVKAQDAAVVEATSPSGAAAEKKNYDAALLSLKDNKYDEAEAKFASFIAKYPKSSMLSNAYFWYGETFFRRNNFEKAAVNYLKGYKQFPKAAKAADSLLKLSLSLGAMGKTKEACGMLTKLESEFRDRPANSIKRAKDARNKYGCK